MTNDCKEHAPRMTSEEMADAIRFTMEDHQRLLRQSDVHDICESQDLCFEYSDRVRCGPCAIKQSIKFGYDVDYTLPFAPEQYRLQHKLKVFEGDVTNLREALEEVVKRYGVNDVDSGKVTETLKANFDNYANLLLQTEPPKTEEEWRTRVHNALARSRRQGS